MSKIVLCGGGTAGHIMPHIALLPHLRKNFKDIIYIGSKGSMEEQIAKNNDLEFYGINCVKLKRSLSAQNLLIPIKLVRSVDQAKQILKKIKPDVVFSKGGYVSLPVVIAAKHRGISVVAHESDYTPGLANKIAGRFVNCVCTSFEPCAKYFKKKGVYTRTPIRNSLMHGDRTLFLQNNKLDTQLKTVLIMGGSSGARAINQALEKCLPSLAARYNVVHITGKGNKNNYYHKNYMQIEFTEDIADCFAAADIVVCRAGANTIFEMLALNKPMLLIPLPKSQSRGDQLQNAQYLQQMGLANVLYQNDLSPQKLYFEINNLFADSAKIKQNIASKSFADGTKDVLAMILKYSAPGIVN